MLTQSQTRWSARLQALPRQRNHLLALARELLYAVPSKAVHMALIEAAFLTSPPRSKVEVFAARTLEWTTAWPRPRLKLLLDRLVADEVLHELRRAHTLRPLPLLTPAKMRPLPSTPPGEILEVPVLETVQALAAFLRLDPEHLLWFADLRDRNREAAQPRLQHYLTRIYLKEDGGARVVEAPKPRLKALQRQIYEEILGAVPLHSAVHGFRRGRSIVTFAGPHAGRDAVLRLDLRDFFPSVSGPRVQALFRTLGYPEPVADLLGGLCTTTTPPQFWKRWEGSVRREALYELRSLYRRPHLPQGAPSSPAIANLCAFRLDRRLTGLAQAAGANYTRYADDLAFSGDAEFARRAERMAAQVAAIAAEEGFGVHHRKTRLMRRSVRQHLAGLTVNERPNVSRAEMDVLEATLFNCVRDGPASQNRSGHPQFRHSLEGRVAFVAMVNPRRAEHLRGLLAGIRWDQAG